MQERSSNMSKKLPFKYPQITSWTWTAAAFAVLENYENARPWLYNNFIQIFCEQYEYWISVHYIPHLDVFSNNPFINSALVNRELISSLGIDIIDFVKKNIDLGYYVYCKVDEGYICREKRFLHELIIFGYEDETESFKIADFTLTKSQKYTFSSTSYQNLKKAYESVLNEEDDMQDGIGGNGGIFIFTVNKVYEYQFNLDALIVSLEDYLNCSDSGKFYRTYVLDKESKFSKGLQGVCYGLDVYDKVIKYYEEVREGKNRFYIQPLHVLYDYHVLMVRRLGFLKEKSIVNISDELYLNYLNLVNEIEQIRNLGVKYWVTKGRSEIEKIIKSLPNIKEKSKINAEKLIKELKR